ncbi:MAG: hypothetical protein CMJ78_00980 [Planctomycetaceae bacterium]|nr:hypothetical protein [Planctomycetaceae bacterium]
MITKVLNQKKKLLTVFFKSSHIIRLNVNVNKKIVNDYQNSNDLLSEICSNLPIDFLACRNDTVYVLLLIFVFTN